MTRRMVEAGYGLLMEFEQGPRGGPALEPYLCPAGRLTIGYGSTGPHVWPGMRITAAEAYALLVRDVGRVERAVERHVRVKLDDGQFAALVCWAFNVGEGWLVDANGGKPGTFIQKLNAGNYAAVPDGLRQFVHSGGRKLPGLVRRREAEVRLWEGGI